MFTERVGMDGGDGKGARVSPGVDFVDLRGGDWAILVENPLDRAGALLKNSAE